MYALAMTEEGCGGGLLIPAADVELGDDAATEEVGLSAVRELALALGLSESDDPALWEPVYESDES